MGRRPYAPRGSGRSQLREMGESTYRLAFVVGLTLGNAVFSENLRAVVEEDEEVEATWYYVDYPRWAGVRTPGSPTAAGRSARTSSRRRTPAKELVHRL